MTPFPRSLKRPSTRRLTAIRTHVQFWIPALLLCGATGVVFGVAKEDEHPMIGAIYALIMGGLVLAFEKNLLFPALHRQIRLLPTLLYVVSAEACYVGFIVAGNVLAGLIVWLTGLRDRTIAEVVHLPADAFLYALLISGVIVTAYRVRDLIGTEVLLNTLLGRYHKPVQEDRIFLFLDIVGSTAYAQEHGDLRAQQFLGAIFASLSEPVRHHRGSIDDYVGDMALVTWRLKNGVRDSRCVACVFDFLERLDHDQERWTREFGQHPRFRAALHGGSVVTAEIGVDRHKISYFGDVVNTTGRMEALCRTLNAPIIISAELLDRLPALPDRVGARMLGSYSLKGRGQDLAILALEQAAASSPAIAEAVRR